MARRRFYGLLLFASFLFAISGCKYPIISRELRQEVQKDLTFTEVLRNPTAYVGSIVIWGGVIVETQNYPNGTEILLLEAPLDYPGRPEDEGFSQGLFIAKTPKYLGPTMYRAGMKITIAGEIIGKETRPLLGQTPYSYPVVAVKEIYLWKVYHYAGPGDPSYMSH